MPRITRSLITLLAVLAVCAVTVVPVMAQSQPDLQPTQIIVTSLYKDATNTITVVIANNEDVAVDSFNVKLEADGVEVATKTGNLILGNNDPWYWPTAVEFEWTPTEAKYYTLRAIVDPADTVDESNETNNQLEQPVTVIELLPVAVKVRVEGRTSTIWSGEVTVSTSTITDKQDDTHTIDHPTALGALDEAAKAGGFSYVVTSAYAPLGFVEEVAGEANDPVTYDGWMYRVDWVSPSVGAVDYAISDNNTEVLWYYGGWAAKPLRLSVDQNSPDSTDSFSVTVESFNGSSWSVVEGATVYVDSQTYTTDANGKVENIPLAPGGCTVFADKGDFTQYTRSNRETVGDILAYYRGLGLDPNVVELSDVVGAANDWINDVVPPGFTAPIILEQLVQLANEWVTTE